MKYNFRITSFFVLSMGLINICNGETMNKNDLIDNIVKVEACINAGHLSKEVRTPIQKRTQYYITTRLTDSEMLTFQVGLEISLKKRKVITTMGWGCESSLKELNEFTSTAIND